MTMDASAVNAIKELAQRAMTRTFSGPHEPDDVYYIRDVGVFAEGDQANLTSRRVVAEPKPRRYSASGVDDFVELVKRMEATPPPIPKGEPAPDAPGVSIPSVVFIDTEDAHVIGVSDEGGARREWVKMQLNLVPAAEFLFVTDDTRVENGVASWSGGQERIIDLLVHTFGLARSSLEVMAVSDVEFKRELAGKLTTTETQQGVSRSTLAEAKSVRETMPKEIMFATHVYEELSEQHDGVGGAPIHAVTLSLTVNAESERFSLHWPENAYRKLCRSAALVLQSVLRAKLGENVVVIGSPNLG